MEKVFQKSFIPKKAFDTLKNAEICYNAQGSFSSEVLETLHSYFDECFVQATELLEKCRVTCYTIPDSSRKVYKISTTQEQYTVFENINFCQCNFFKNKVLDAQTSLSCKHVLAVYLARSIGKVREEVLKENVFEEYLNVVLNSYLDVETQEMF